MSHATPEKRETGTPSMDEKFTLDLEDMSLKRYLMPEGLKPSPSWPSVMVDKADYDRMKSERNEARERVAVLEAGYKEAIKDIQEWSAYASDFFKLKHDLAGNLEKHEAILSMSPPFSNPLYDFLVEALAYSECQCINGWECRRCAALKKVRERG